MYFTLFQKEVILYISLCIHMIRKHLDIEGVIELATFRQEYLRK